MTYQYSGTGACAHCIHSSDAILGATVQLYCKSPDVSDARKVVYCKEARGMSGACGPEARFLAFKEPKAPLALDDQPAREGLNYAGPLFVAEKMKKLWGL